MWGVKEKEKQLLFSKACRFCPCPPGAASSDFPPSSPGPKFRFEPKMSNVVQVGLDFRLEIAPGFSGKFWQGVILLSKF